MPYHDIITIEEGKPCIRGMRITVLASGMNYEEISTQSIIEFDSYAKFKAISKQGNIDKGLMLLDKLDNLTP